MATKKKMSVRSVMKGGKNPMDESKKHEMMKGDKSADKKEPKGGKVCKSCGQKC